MTVIRNVPVVLGVGSIPFVSHWMTLYDDQQEILWEGMVQAQLLPDGQFNLEHVPWSPDLNNQVKSAKVEPIAEDITNEYRISEKTGEHNTDSVTND